MTLNEILRKRRSIRQYKPDPLPAETIQQVLEAGRLAPSGKNQQNWHFTVVTSGALRGRMVDACLGQAMVGQAPAVLVVWAGSDSMMHCNQSAATVDCSIATTCMMLKATELGIGTCWLGAFNADGVKNILNLPEGAVVVAVLTMGIPDEAPFARSRKPLPEISDIREE